MVLPGEGTDSLLDQKFCLDESVTITGAADSTRFVLGPLLGRGGMGSVYRAKDCTTGADVAVKLLHEHRLTRWTIARFKREFRAAARLRHPHCLRVFELSEDAGQWFYTMEWAKGGPVRTDAAWGADVAVNVALQCLSALDYIHSKGIVHRDVKPDNILMDGALEGAPPRVRLADFGISKTSDLDDIELGGVVGSLAYAAPEQIEERQADHRSDLYSLGIAAGSGKSRLLGRVLRQLAAEKSPVLLATFRTDWLGPWALGDLLESGPRLVRS